MGFSNQKKNIDVDMVGPAIMKMDVELFEHLA